MTLKAVTKVLKDEKGDLSSGIEFYIIIFIIAMIFSIAIPGLLQSPSWIQAIGALVYSILIFISCILLIFVIGAVLYYLDLINAYYSCVNFKAKKGELYLLDIANNLKRVLAYKIVKNMIVVICEDLDGRKRLQRESVFQAPRALKVMRNLLETKYNFPELIIDEEKLNKMVQKWNSDDEIKYLTKRELSKFRSRESLSDILNETEPLIDLNNTHRRSRLRLHAVIDVFWRNKREADDILFQLVFKEVMVNDICSGREQMRLHKRIWSMRERRLIF